MAGIQKFKIDKITDIAPNTKTFRLVPKQGSRFDFKPGQFVTLRLTDPETHAPVARSYSICSSPLAKGYLEVTITKAGKYSTQIFGFEEGDEIELLGPSGTFIIDDAKMKDVVFIAGGSGVTPFASMMRYYAEKGTGPRITLIYSCKTVECLLLYSEFRKIARQVAFIRIAPTITRPEESGPWRGHTGRIDAAYIREVAGDISGKYFFACGPKEMLDATSAALKEIGVSEDRIIIEKW
jgi:glycine betaine catabolism B